MKDMTYESAVAELESLVYDLENKVESLEDSITKYKRGCELVKFCQEKLDSAQLVIEELGTDKKEK